MKFYKLLISLLAVVTLCGCGQMGPLYIPIEVAPVAPQPAAAKAKMVESEIKPVEDQPIPLEKQRPVKENAVETTPSPSKKTKAQ
jgi:predicted small lipoprotein YifL